MEKGRLLKDEVFGEIKDVGVCVTIHNGKQKYWIRCILEDMPKFHITQDGYTITAVEKEAK